MTKHDNTAGRQNGMARIPTGIKVLDVSVAIVPNNQRPILGRFTDDETIVLGGMLDRLDALEEAIRVRPNAKAIAAFRDSIMIDMEMGGEPVDRLAVQAGAILLDMLDKIMAVKP